MTANLEKWMVGQVVFELYERNYFCWCARNCLVPLNSLPRTIFTTQQWSSFISQPYFLIVYLTFVNSTNVNFLDRLAKIWWMNEKQHRKAASFSPSTYAGRSRKLPVTHEAFFKKHFRFTAGKRKCCSKIWPKI